MRPVRYQVLGSLRAGEGSNAQLGLAVFEEGRAEPCVVVFIPEDAEHDQQALARIQKETEHAAQLDHPNIVTVFGFATLEDGHARVVEFADGESLRRVLNLAGKLPVRIAARIVCDACTGVHYAHLAGNDDGSSLVHGDLRPETILLSFAGITKVTGYGALAFAPREIGGQRVKGRRIHSSPEQIIGGRGAITIPSDVYLLGLTLYELLTGEVPWSEDPDAFDQAVLTYPLPPASPGLIPEALLPVIEKATEKKATQRYPTALALKDAIAKAVRDDIASVEEISSFLETLFPGAGDVRAERRRTIDAGIANFARQQWSQKPTQTTAAVQPPLASPPITIPDVLAVSAPATTPTLPTLPLLAPAPPLNRSGQPTTLPGVPVHPHGLAPSHGRTSPVQPARPESASPPYPAPAANAERVSTPPSSTPSPDEETPATPRWRMPLFVALGVVASLCIGALALSTASRKPRSRPPAPPVAQAIATETRLAEPAESPAVLPQPATPTVDAGLPPPQKPTPATELKVTIDSRPAVDLTIDGTTVGRTPWSGLLALGSHKLKLENRDLLINASRTLTVQGTEPLTQSYEFAKGTVAVNAPAGAAILVDGKKLGVAPLQNDLSLYEGFHRIVVKVGQAQWTESFSLYEGQRVSFNVELE